MTISTAVRTFRIGKQRLQQYVNEGQISVHDGSDDCGRPARLVRVRDLELLGIKRKTPIGRSDLFLEERVDLLADDLGALRLEMAELRGMLESLGDDLRQRLTESPAVSAAPVEIAVPVQQVSDPSQGTGFWAVIVKAIAAWIDRRSSSQS